MSSGSDGVLHGGGNGICTSTWVSAPPRSGTIFAPDQQLAALLQRVVEPLPVGPGVLRAGLLAERLQHRLHRGGAFRGQVPADHARALEGGADLHVPVLEPVIIPVGPGGEPVAIRDRRDDPQVILAVAGPGGPHQDLDRRDTRSARRLQQLPSRPSPAHLGVLRDLRGGTALFTMPAGPIKCAGAPQKIAYLAADWWRSQGVLDRWPTVFALGDASNLPTSKTGAAARKQAVVLVNNLLAAMNGRSLPASYNGYTSCPLVTPRNRMLLAEFDYDLKRTPSFPFINTLKPRYDTWLLKRYGLPSLYWNVMLKGRLDWPAAIRMTKGLPEPGSVGVASLTRACRLDA
jgi:hypothetical protein